MGSVINRRRSRHTMSAIVCGLDVHKDSTAGNNVLKYIHQLLESLNGKTPSEACGIKIEGKNKWLTLIQNASKKKDC